MTKEELAKNHADEWRDYAIREYGWDKDLVYICRDEKEDSYLRGIIDGQKRSSEYIEILQNEKADLMTDIANLKNQIFEMKMDVCHQYNTIKGYALVNGWDEKYGKDDN